MKPVINELHLRRDPFIHVLIKSFGSGFITIIAILEILFYIIVIYPNKFFNLFAVAIKVKLFDPALQVGLCFPDDAYSSFSQEFI